MRLISLGMVALVMVGAIDCMEPAPKRRKLAESISSSSDEESYSSGSSQGSMSEYSPRYYQTDALNKLRNGEPRHAALVIIADFDRDDVVQLETDLTNSLKHQSILILVSTNVLVGLLKTYNDPLGDTWQAYEIPESDFVLLVAREWHNYYQSAGIIFPSTRMVNISKTKASLMRQSDKSHQRYKTYRTGKSGYKPFGFLEKLFDTKRSASNNVTWDVLMIGHTGDVTKGEELVGVDIASLRALFSFLDTKITSGVVLLSSCQIGGVPLNVIEVDNQVPHQHRFILIVSTTTDVPTTDIYDISAVFNTAATLDRGGQLDRLLNLLTLDPKMIPQIWLPGLKGFFSLQANPHIFLIGNVIEQAHALEKKPIIIDDKQAVVLVRPVAIYPQLTINHKKFDDLEPGSLAMANYLTYDSKTLPGALKVLKEAVNEDSFEQLIEIMGILRKKGYFNTFGKQKIDRDRIDALERSLYPMIISLGRGSTATWFNSIALPDTTSMSGVLDCMFQSFCYSIDRTYPTVSLIDSIAGGNDIVFWREMITAIHLANQLKGLGQKSLTQAPLEQWVSAHPMVKASHEFAYLSGKKTATLTHVRIVNNNPTDECELTFVLDNKAWSIRYSFDKLWFIKEINLQEYERAYEQQKQAILKEGRSVIQGQKPLTQVLSGVREKKDTIKRKQEELIRQGLPSYLRK